MGNYLDEVTADVQQVLEEAGCQPIIFVGSGLSVRYFKAPTWNGLLEILATRCGSIARPLAYYLQKCGNAIDVGEEFAGLYQEWAWGDGRAEFPSELFAADQLKHIYLKHAAARAIREMTPVSLDAIDNSALQKELSALRAIRPHALITTNYDTFLEMLYPDFATVVGQSILSTDYSAIGEIFKIHGCTSDPSSLVLTRSDFDEWDRKKKYVSAKLLTYLTEHPVLIVGYSGSDPNIQGILADIDEVLSPDDALISNIFFLEWDPTFDPEASHAREKLIQVGEHRSVRVKCIYANDFTWVFKAFAAKGALQKVNTKLLRALLARMFELVRVDIPRQRVEVDFEVLERTLNDAEGIPTLFGFTSLDTPGAINAQFPYTLTEVAQRLGYQTWHRANELIDKIKNETGKDLKASDNAYHSKVPMGKSTFRKYSERAVHLLESVLKGEEYDVSEVP